ncbi:unnamed protein product [Urochloa humidicola]
MAKFSFDDGDDDPPAAGSAGEKRKREDGQAEAVVGGVSPKARSGEPEGGAVVGVERAKGAAGRGRWRWSLAGRLTGLASGSTRMCSIAPSASSPSDRPSTR